MSIVAFAAVLFREIAASATTYMPVSFDDLVTRADVIFIGEVTDVRPFPLETPDGAIIKTRVIFRVSDPLWGTTSYLALSRSSSVLLRTKKGGPRKPALAEGAA